MCVLVGVAVGLGAGMRVSVSLDLAVTLALTVILNVDMRMTVTVAVAMAVVAGVGSEVTARMAAFEKVQARDPPGVPCVFDVIRCMMFNVGGTQRAW